MKSKSSVLTLEERGILLLAAQGLTNEEIAEHLDMSLVKVKGLVHQASVKLGVRNRYGAALVAVLEGHIRIDEVFPPCELAEYLMALDPDMLIEITKFVCMRARRRILPVIDKRLLPQKKKQNTVLPQGERDVLILAARGLTNREIAERLCIPVRTVKGKLYRAFSRLGTCSRKWDAVMFALKQGALELSDVISPDEIIQALAHVETGSLEQIARLMRTELERENASK